MNTDTPEILRLATAALTLRHVAEETRDKAQGKGTSWLSQCWRSLRSESQSPAVVPSEPMSGQSKEISRRARHNSGDPKGKDGEARDIDGQLREYGQSDVASTHMMHPGILMMHYS